MGHIDDKSLGYNILKQPTKWLFLLTHRRFTVNGLEHVPQDKPVIFAPNHQNALLDPLAIIFAGNFQPVFLARADIFKNKIVAAVLRFLKIMPVYRIRDGKETLDKNKGVFDQAVAILQNNNMLCLFPEASHIGMKSMLPHKKAIPRIVFAAAEATSFELDIQIVPVGINYTSYFGFRRSVAIHFGLSIHTKPYYKIFMESGENKASSAMRDTIFEAVKKLVVHVPEKHNYPLYEQAFEMASAGILHLNHMPQNDFVAREQWLTETITRRLKNLTSDDNDPLASATQYKILKTKLKLSEKGILPIAPRQFYGQFTLFALTLPLIIWGVLVNGLVFYLTRYPYRKKIEDPQFYSSFSFVLSLVAYPLWYTAVFCSLIHFGLSPGIGLLATLAAIPSGIMAWESGQKIKCLQTRIKYKKLQKRQESFMTDFFRLRDELIRFYMSCNKK